MKTYLKLMTISMAALLLVACGSQEEPASTSVEEASTEQTSDQSVADSTESQASQTSEDASQASDASTDESTESSEETTTGDEVTGEAVTVTLYVTGETEPHATFEVPFEEGMNVLGALEAQDEVDFNFNEDEGVIDMIDGIENDYGMGYTWAYLLNGAFAELGVVSQTLEAGDEISWYYGTIDEIPVNIIPEAGETLPDTEPEEAIEDPAVEDAVAEEDVTL